MKTQSDILDNVLGITDVVETSTRNVTPPKEVIVPETKSNNEDIDNDYKYQRENFYNLIERGNDAITGILDLARKVKHLVLMKLLEILLNRLQRLQKNLVTYRIR